MQPSEFWAADTWTVMDAYQGYLDDVHLRLTGNFRTRGQTGLTADEIKELQDWMSEDDG